MKKNSKIKLFLPLFLLIGIGVTIAYFFSSTTFSNIFYAKKVPTVKTVEKFKSPDNWEPGDETPKTLITTNVDSDDDICIRLKIDEEWLSKNGNVLSLTQDGQKVSLINFINEDKWKYALDGYYYYQDSIQKGESSVSPLESVTFNPKVTASNTCTREVIDDEIIETCSSDGNGYNGGKYTLTLTTEAVTCEKADILWNPTYAFSQFRRGTNINLYMRNLFGYQELNSPLNFEDVHSFQRSYEIEDKYMTDDYIVSTSESNVPIYLWAVDNDIYWYSPLNYVYAGQDTTAWFVDYVGVQSIDLEGIDFSKTTNMTAMLGATGSYSTDFKINLGKRFDTSSVTEMSALFSLLGWRTTGLVLDLGDKFNISNVTNSYNCFNSWSSTQKVLVPNETIQAWVIAQNPDVFSTDNVLIR